MEYYTTKNVNIGFLGKIPKLTFIHFIFGGLFSLRGFKSCLTHSVGQSEDLAYPHIFVYDDITIRLKLFYNEPREKGDRASCLIR